LFYSTRVSVSGLWLHCHNNRIFLHFVSDVIFPVLIFIFVVNLKLNYLDRDGCGPVSIVILYS